MHNKGWFSWLLGLPELFESLQPQSAHCQMTSFCIVVEVCGARRPLHLPIARLKEEVQTNALGILYQNGVHAVAWNRQAISCP
mmetsp:Transcript_15127/g.22655  ORF Transcript_15127/g.22655 Transcript_15127/m.22655 type:complete len:83 (-) Transcript_15127:422-670(-)